VNTARADALSARSRISAGAWIPRSAESFRHLPPPAAEVWLGEPAQPQASRCDASPLAGAGWTLLPMGTTPPGRVDARWLDAADPVQRAELFAGLPAPGDEDAAPFAWAHRALVRQGLRLRIGAASERRSAGREETVWVHLRHQPRAEVEAPMLVIDLHQGAQLVLIEAHEREAPHATGCQRALVQNLHVHLRLGAGATLRHLRIVAPGVQDRVAHHVHARLDRGARYHQGLLASGSPYHLQRSEIDLFGEQALARTAGVLLADASSVLEQQVQVAHGAAHTASTVDVLALGSGSARIVANAHTRIAPGADEAQARQRLSGIPTAGQPRLVLRPHLEIHHDRVQAAHGATWGALPEDALFYALQRGLDERAARALILQGMAGATLARALDLPELMTLLDVDGQLGRALARHLAVAARPDAPGACYA
jgi:Fe-S cluster assembly protein SufD